MTLHPFEGCVWPGCPAPATGPLCCEQHQAWLPTPLKLAAQRALETASLPRFRECVQAVRDLAAQDAAKCGAPALAFIPRWGMSWACALPKGHEGEHQRGGTCFAHGQYVGEKCPQWPACEQALLAADPYEIPSFLLVPHVHGDNVTIDAPRVSIPRSLARAQRQRRER